LAAESQLANDRATALNAAAEDNAARESQYIGITLRDDTLTPQRRVSGRASISIRSESISTTQSAYLQGIIGS
jgi:hypothetical protein